MALLAGLLTLVGTSTALTLDANLCSQQGITYDTPGFPTYGWAYEGTSVGGVNRGKSFVAWSSTGLQGAQTEYRVFGAIVDSDASTLLTITPLSDLDGDQVHPSVTTRAYGNSTRVVVAWAGYNDLTGGSDVRTRIYSYNEGSPNSISGGGGFYVPRGSAGDQDWPQAQYLYDGSQIAFAWEDETQGRIEYRLCDVAGSCSLTDRVPHVTSAGAGFHDPRLDAFETDSGFVMVWASNRLTSANDGTADYNIYYRRFDDTGTPIDAAEVLVSPDNSYDERYPDVAVLDSDTFAVTWWDQSTTTGDVWFQLFEYDGTPIGTSHWVGVGRLPLAAGYDVGRRTLALAFDAPDGSDWYRKSQTFTSVGYPLTSALQGGQLPGPPSLPHAGVDQMDCHGFVMSYEGLYSGSTSGVAVEYPSH